MKVSTEEKLPSLDDTMHLHVGYDEHGNFLYKNSCALTS